MTIFSNLKCFFIKEFWGWSKLEKVVLPIILFIVLFVSFCMRDNWVATISALCGISYTILAGKGKISCYFIGMVGTICYSYLSWENALFGNLILYLGYYFPMEIVGIFAWKKHLKKDKQEIKKTFLSYKQRWISLILLIIFSLILSFVFKNFGDSSPFLDGITTVCSILGMYLTVKRCIEQWVIWTFVNLLSAIMWLKLFLFGSETFATFLMWAVYLILGIYFFVKWKEELSEKSNVA